MRFIVATCLAVACVAASAQETNYPAIKLTTPPTIDGTISSEEWAGVTPVKGGFDEETGAPEPIPTEYWFAYDEKFIYFAAKVTDDKPETIRAQEYRSNVAINGDDMVGIFIDPFNNINQSANQFDINPRGATNLRIAGGRAAKREWLGEILAKGRMTSTGYEVEARIPWAVLRLPPAGKRDMRIGAYRVSPRLGKAYLNVDLSGNHEERIPFWRGVEVPAIASERLIKLLPYMYVGYDKRAGGMVFNSGLDFKTQTGTLDIVGAINPDFRNIENQVLSLDFSYFERLAGESRPFFLEGNNFFQTSQDAPLFVSQRIPSFDFGAKAFGKLGDKTTIAVLDTVEFNKRNDFVGVVRHSFGARSGLTLAAANQTLHDSPTLGNNNNLGTFISYSRPFLGPSDFFGQYMTTQDGVRGSGHRTNTGLTFAGKGIDGYAEYVEISPNFLPRIGFAPETNFKGVGGGFDLTRHFSKGLLMEHQIGIYGHDYDNYQGGGKYRRQINLYNDIALRNNLGIGFGAFYREFRNFKDHLFNAYLVNPRNDPYRSWSAEAELGKIAGTDYKSVGAGVRYRPVKDLQLNLSYQHVNHVDTTSRTILSGNYDLNAFDSIAGRMIQTGKDINFYLAFRRTGNSGNEYFLILGDPNADRFRFTIIAKAVFPMNLRF